MLFQWPKTFFIALFFLQMSLYAQAVLVDPMPIAVIRNPGHRYSLINSIDFHPNDNLFCVTFTHNNQVALYKINTRGKPEMVQSLCNPSSQLSQPQHAVFSPDGNKMVVANWKNQSLTIYQREETGLFREKPVSVISPAHSLMHHKPHGIAFSPCGNYLAIAYGAAAYHGKAVAIFYVPKEGLDMELIYILEEQRLPGIPKGITFSPDGRCLLVTFSDANALVIFNLHKDHKTLLLTPRQIIQGKERGISRPEDVKITADGNYCAITNSDLHHVTFYPFDKTVNRITQSTPCEILQNPEADFWFPHGMTFSPDGSFLLVTEFGHVNTAKDGNITWDSKTRPEESKFNVYKLNRKNVD